MLDNLKTLVEQLKEVENDVLPTIIVLEIKKTITSLESAIEILENIRKGE